MEEQQSLQDLTLGNVRLVEMLGQGAMGTVYKAEHITLRTPYAVKVLNPRLSKDAVVAERFRREAMMCSKLRHPNIVFVTDFGYHDSVGLYLVMEFLNGQTLRDLLDEHESGLPIWRAVDIMQQLCEAFTEAHQAGVIHRDTKPENIYVVEQRKDHDLIKVLDFGIARLTESEEGELTKQGQLIGTPSYMSPEQINASAPISAQTDIYALGILLYELLTGRPPFAAPNPMELMVMHMMQHIPPIHIHRPELKDSLIAKLILEMVEKKPQDRPESTGLISQRLTYALQELQQKGLDDAYGHQGISANPHQDVSSVEEEIIVPIKPSLRGRYAVTSTGVAGVFNKFNLNDATQTRLTTLYQMAPELDKLPAPIFFLTSWGSVLRELIDEPVDSPIFTQTLQHLGTLMETLLASPQTTSKQVEDVHHLIRCSVQELIALTSQEKHIPTLSAFQHLTSHYLFPQDALPDWAQAQTSGTWTSLRSVLTSDIRDIFKKKK